MRRILFLCTGNSARSQLAEALLNWRGAGRFQAFSAGSRPAGFVHAAVLPVLEELLVRPGKLRSKSWEELKDQPFDAVITLCGSARDEVCPRWPAPKPGALLPVRAHWGFSDPSRAWAISIEDRLREFRITRDAIRDCIEQLALAPEAVVNDDARFAEFVARIGESLDDEEAGEASDGPLSPADAL